MVESGKWTSFPRPNNNAMRGSRPVTVRRRIYTNIVVVWRFESGWVGWSACLLSGHSVGIGNWGYLLAGRRKQAPRRTMTTQSGERMTITKDDDRAAKNGKGYDRKSFSRSHSNENGGPIEPTDHHR